MRRREIIAVLGSAALAWPLSAYTQQMRIVPRVGILWIAPEPVVTPFHEAFRQELRDLGYIEGQTIVIEARFAGGKIEALQGLAEELVRLKADVIVAPSTPAVWTLKQATKSIPIVMANVSDPVGFGFVASLREPGGNITGFSNLMVEQVGKTVELAKEAIPNLVLLAVMVNSAAPDSELVLKETQLAAQTLKFEVVSVEARVPDQLEGAVARASGARADALLVSTIEGMFFANRNRIIEAAAKHRLPAVFAAPPYGLTSAGALLTYGANTPDLLRRSATYVDKILKGVKPAELPVQQPVKFELGVNLKSANALGLTIPTSILLRADEVIE
ncbi:ABC transporter substrate-binding protein [Bradyrhizobium arachidis]|uniref:ABC transporter substrate-binding protein n=1 Tax=Bradyrhizobium arachidis TaxID=858423 RepID=UPI002161F1B7|nr:ABC transporter substrate-binding protein [Bradyrhizobium arachidis]UVO27047.1 ABC transporter substrate-binding protein [Bradyrhizobium arachidis]